MLLTALLLAGGLASGAVSDCGSAGLWGANCEAINTGSSVDIGASYSSPGGSAERGSGASGRSGGGGGAADPGEAVVPEDCGPLNRCGTYEVVLIREATMSDVESFAPSAAPLAGEPGGVGIVGMPVNFVVTAGPHEASGMLFDLPVRVRFVPASFAFVHGDGTSREATTGGRTWAALGQAQFTATPTSHAYAARGTYSAHALVRYAAAVDFGNGWMPVPGQLEQATASVPVEVLEVRTALVDRTCAENPSGPGC